MISKARMLEWVKGFAWKDVEQGVDENSKLLEFRDERGRSWLHLCCGVNIAKTKRSPVDSIKTAEVLLKRSLDVNEAASTEGKFFEATPLW